METGKTWLIKDLVGFEVVTVEGEVLGCLRDVMKTGGNDIFMVGEGLAEILVPALKEVVLDIDVSAKRITVKLPPGLR